ncbi:MAG: hypothetical protein KDA24_07585 [Deltaproteobacteria bacterium]|nr:hypothetical protein [Deltaproteobacteria bacterium]
MRPGSSLPLVRRAVIDGELREFVHPPDGSMPVEREVGSAPEPAGEAEPLVLGGPIPEAGVNRLGQLVGRNVEPRDLARPMALPFLRASCDGSGSCCGLYHHIPAMPQDATRIRSLLADDWDRDVPLDDVFVPAFDAHPDGPLNVLDIEGSCAFLDPDGLCAVHKKGGIEAKPQACINYPAHLVVCGERWVASLRPECACMMRTATDGPRLSDDPTGWAQLRSMMAAVWTVPMLVTIEDDVVVTRTAYRKWTERQVAALSNTLDPVATLCIAHAELDVVAELDPYKLENDQLLDPDWLRSLQPWLADEVALAKHSHAPTSPLRIAAEWGAECVDALLAGEEPARREGRGRAADWNRRAALTTAHIVHGHGLLEEAELRPALTRLARFVALARASRQLRPLEERDDRLEELTAWFFLWRTLGR